MGQKTQTINKFPCEFKQPNFNKILKYGFSIFKALNFQIKGKQMSVKDFLVELKAKRDEYYSRMSKKRAYKLQQQGQDEEQDINIDIEDEERKINIDDDFL